MKKFLILTLILISIVSVKNSYASEYTNEDYVYQCGGYVDHNKRNNNSDYDYTNFSGRDFDKNGNEMY